ncbi:hypothetical protein [Variovorax rhizosphaerae]|uniref:Integrase catalytic domain-containing protein n=1 Tax=Variovorax rhizosphaerae TaxID=1836200 RepID=A0ABU8WWE8_9BURK
MSAAQLDLDLGDAPEVSKQVQAGGGWLPTLIQATPLGAGPQVAATGPHKAAVNDHRLLLDSGRPRFRQVGKYSVHTVPSHLRDPESWGKYDPSTLARTLGDGQKESDYDRHQRFYAGIQHYCKTEILNAAAELAKTSSSELLRVYNRCLWQDQFGRPWGFAATVKGAHSGTYDRTAPVSGESGPRGKAGAFRYFLATHPEVLMRTVAAINPHKGALRLSHGSVDVVYNAFREACNDEGIDNDEYPLATDSGAHRSIRRLIDKYLDGNPEALEYWYGAGASEHLLVGSLGDFFQLAQHPYGECMIDAHRVDVLGTTFVMTPHGPKTIPISRLWLVVAACTTKSSGAAIGFSWSYEDKPSAETIERAILRAQMPWKVRPLCGGLNFMPDAGLPNGVVAGLEGAPITSLRMDNDSANWAAAIQENLRQALGCHIVYGPVKKWFTNARLERLFRALNQAGLHLMPSTTGSGPQDKKRPRNPGKAAVEAPVDFTFLHDVIETTISAMNAEKRASQSDMSSLEIIRNSLTLGANRWLPRPSAPPSPFAPRLGWVDRWCRIAGDRSTGLSPYFEMYGTRYSSPDIKHRWDLVGEHFLRRVCRADSAIEGFFADGREMRDIRALGQAEDVKMPLSLKASLYGTKNRRKAPFIDLPKALERLMHELATQAAQDASKRPNKISKAATQFAQIIVLYEQNGLRAPQTRLVLPGSVPAHSSSGDEGNSLTHTLSTASKNVVPLRPSADFALVNKRGRR